MAFYKTIENFWKYCEDQQQLLPPPCAMKKITPFRVPRLLMALTMTALGATDGFAEVYTYIRSASSGAGWTQRTGNYSPDLSKGTGITKEDDLFMQSTAVLGVSGGAREVNNLTSIIKGATIAGTTDAPGSLTIYGNLSIESNASLMFRSGANGATLDVDIKGNVTVEADGLWQLGSPGNANHYVNSLVVAGTTVVNGTVSGHGNNPLVKLGDFKLGSTGQLVMVGDGGSGSFNTTTEVRSLSGSGEIIGSLMTGSGLRSLTFDVNTTAASNGVFAGVLLDGGSNNVLSVKVRGEGTQTLTNQSHYTGSTTISGATLVLADGDGTSGSINTSSQITIEGGGRLMQNSSVTLNAPINLTHGALGGSGRIAGDFTIGENQTLEPGNGVGSQTFEGNQTWVAGGNLNWQIHDASGTSGTGYDTLLLEGTLDLSGLGESTRFNLNLESVANGEMAGDAINFDLAQSYQWLLVTADEGIVLNDPGIVSDLFAIHTGAYNGTDGFANAFLGNWFVSLGNDGKSLYLNYQAVPEPNLFSMLAAGAIGMVLFARKRNRF